jgi:hypothetical protein
VEKIPAKCRRRHIYSEGMTVHVANNDKKLLQQLLTLYGKDLSVGQHEGIKILLEIEEHRILLGGHKHHQHPTSEDGHPTHPDNLIRL